MLRSPVLALALAAAPADAPSQPAVRLSLDAGPATCLDETTLRDAVAARLGYRPFQDDAPDRVEIRGIPAKRGFAARVERFDAQGQSLGRRDLTAETCPTLAPAIALALSIAIDPMSLTRSPAAAPPAAPPAPTAPAPPALAMSPQTPDATPTSAPLGVEVQAGGAAALGLAASVAGCISVGAELRWPGASIALEGQGSLPVSTPVGGGGSVQVSTLFATLSPCLRLGYFGACALGSAGSVQIDGVGLIDAAHKAAPFFGVGARALGELPLWGPLGLRLQIDALAPLAHTTVLAGAEQIWTTPSLAAEATLALSVRLR